MREFIIEDNTYNVPLSWNDVSVAKFESLLDTMSNKDSYSGDIEFSLRIVSSITDIPFNILKGISNQKFEEINDYLSWASHQVVSNNKKEFLINGITYVPVSNYNGLTMGEAIDSETIIKDTPPNNLISALLPLLVRRAVLKGKGKHAKTVPSSFDAENYQELKEEMKHNLMIADVMQLKGFF